MLEFALTDRNTIRRLPERGHYDRETIYAIVDEARYCHVGFVQDGRPFVIPTIHARMEDTLVFHGSPSSRILRHMAAGYPLCVTVTLLDGLVLGRSISHHSMNYRSAMLFGSAHPLEGEEKLKALEAITEHLVPGRWADARRADEEKLQATLVVAMEIESASAKVRIGPPKDDEEDYALPVWAGVLPVREAVGKPEPDPHLDPGVAVPDYISRLVDK